jgi:hypothetical protein
MFALRCSLILAPVLALGLAGCNRGPQLAEVEGTLKLRGKPLPGVLVCFVPDAGAGTPGPRSTGWTDEQGRYQLVCDTPPKPGAVVGQHCVVVFDPEAFDELVPADGPGVLGGGAERPAPRRDRKPKRLQFALKYMMPMQTPLRVEVQAPGPQTIDLEIK